MAPPDTSDGIAVAVVHAFNTTIDRNSIDSSSDSGIRAAGGAFNAITGNDLAENAVGIWQNAGQVNAAFVGNRVETSTLDGIRIDPTIGGITTIERNVSSDNGNDGLNVHTPHAVITKNRADDDVNLGIEAVPGVTDGGGNKARGSGSPAQCANVQ